MAEVFGLESMKKAIQDELKSNEKVAGKLPSQDVIAEVLKAEHVLIQGAVKDGDKVRYIGFGTFESRERASRMGRNPQTGEALEIPAMNVPAFKPGQAFKDLVK